MFILKAKIKPHSKYYKNGTNNFGHSVWLEIVDFRAIGNDNYKLKAVKDVKNGIPIWFELWLPICDVKIQKFNDKQLKIPFEYEDTK